MEAELEPRLVPLPAPETIQRTAEEVLKRPDYQLEGSAYDMTPLVRQVHRAISSVLDFFRHLHDLSPILYWLVLLFLLLLLAALITHIVLTFRAALRPRPPSAPRGPAGEADETPEDWERQGRAAAQSGAYLAALRFLFRAGVLRLSRARGKAIARGATNGEILRLYRGTAAHGPLAELIGILHAKWYGGGVCEPGDYETGARAHAALRRAAQGMRDAHRP